VSGLPGRAAERQRPCVAVDGDDFVQAGELDHAGGG
jgi:hypothetical protein